MPHRNPLFREVLETFLADYLRLVEPDSAAHLRLDRLALLDAPAPSGRAAMERQEVGVVGEAPSRWGETVTVMVQVEPEALTPGELSRRIGGYFADREIHYCQPVLLSVLYLRGGRPGVNLETAPVCRILNTDILRIYFSAFGVAGSRAEYYLERPEPIAWALSALMEPLRLNRVRHRELCLERIAACGLAGDRRDLLARFVDAFLQER
jgi:hypothetical protein